MPSRANYLVTAHLALAILGLSACNAGDGLLLPSEGAPASIAVLAGDAQHGRVGEPLSDLLVFVVTDTRNRPVEGATVAFELTGASPGADVIPHTATTDANGMVNVQMVLGTSIGQQTGTARVVMGSGSHAPEVSFTALALPENANSMAPVGGEDQTGRVGSPLTNRLVIKVTDAFDNPINGVPISWSVVGGGSVSDVLVNTNAEGLASVERILGPSTGQQSTIASSEGLGGSPVTFVHAALAGDASLLTIISGDNQTGQAGSELSAELVVRLIDGEGNGVPGTPVAWVVAIGGGSIIVASSVTDDDGRAAARWTLGPVPGANRLDAVVSGIGVASFDAIGTAGTPAALAVRTQPPATARNGARFDRDPVVQLQDARGNPVASSGVQVGVALGTGSGDLSGTRQHLTDGNGRATFNDLAISGPIGRYTLVFSSPGYASVTSDEIDLRAIPTVTTITSDLPDPTAPGTPFRVEFRVSSQGPTPTGSVTVTDGVQSCSGTLSSGVGGCDVALSTPGDRTLRATYPGGPGLNGSSGTEAHRVQAPPPQNQPPTADYTATCEGLTCRFTDQSSDPDGSIASRTWNFGDGSGASTEKNPTHAFPGAGTYTVALSVTDNDGATAGTSNGVTVSEPPPPPNKVPHVDFDAHCTNLDCSFTDKSKDDDGTIAAWQWSFGDGQSSNETNPDHSYAVPGKYQVTLTVTDNSGASDSRSHDVDAKAPPPASTTVTITGNSPDPSGFGAPVTVSFTVSSSTGTPDGTVLVTEQNGGSCSGSAPSGSCTLVPVGSGTRDLTVTYQGNSSFKESSAKQSHTVQAPPPAQTSTTITSDNPDPSEQNVAFTVTFAVTSVGGVPDGSVTVSDGTDSCSGNLAGDGTGSCSITLTTAGTQNLTATYAGDSGFAGSVSSPESHEVTAPPEPSALIQSQEP